MSNAVAIALMFILPLAFLAAVCAYGPLADRIHDRRLPQREADWAPAPRRAVPTARLRQPGWGIGQLTPAGWAQLVPAGGVR